MLRPNNVGHIGSFFRFCGMQNGSSLPNGCDKTLSVAMLRPNNGVSPWRIVRPRDGHFSKRGASC